MGEKIIQPPFYNSGFYNTGAGGAKSWFHETFISSRGTPQINKDAICGNGSALCGFYPEKEINSNNYLECELSIHYKLDPNQTSPGTNILVLYCIGYDNIWNGTRNPLALVHDCSTKAFTLYSRNTSGNEYTLYAGNSGQLENVFKAKFDFVNLSVNLQMNDSNLGDFSVLVRPTKWTPTFFASLNANKLLNTAYLNSKGLIYLEGTYLKLDDDMIFGYDE